VAVFDEVHYWTEVKLDIVREYASAYSTILAAQARPRLHHVYVDAFAGAGMHVSKRTGDFIPGSPLNALAVKPPFREYHLIDLNSDKTGSLRALTAGRSNVTVHDGDCNGILLNDVFPRARYEDYRRALCLLDPYGLHLNWEVIQTAGEMRSVDMFLNFPVMDMNRNVLWRNLDRVDPKQVARMNGFWGDDTWRSVAYSTSGNLFGFEEKNDPGAIARGFQERLKKVGGFRWVPDPLPMRNSIGAVVYYLFFASHKPAADNIVRSIFKKYWDAGAGLV
jgi:three-Cys-motif partner protein